MYVNSVSHLATLPPAVALNSFATAPLVFQTNQVRAKKVQFMTEETGPCQIYGGQSHARCYSIAVVQKFPEISHLRNFPVASWITPFFLIAPGDRRSK
jgi:hypothetical protein